MSNKTHSPKNDRLLKIVENESFLWGDDVAETYHGAAEKDMENHWQEIIWPTLREFDIDFSSVLDFACGHGRNARYLLPLSEKVTMVDVNKENIIFCQDSFTGNKKAEIVSCNGISLNNIEDKTNSFVYTFDSMVHFDVELISSYLHEFHRVLDDDGIAFIHHSNYSQAPGGDFRKTHIGETT